MKRTLLFFALAFAAITTDITEAKTPARNAPKPLPPRSAPVAPAPDPLPESVPIARQLTAQEDLELRDWIAGMMKEGELAKAETVATKAELKTAIGQAAVAELKEDEANKKLDTVDVKIAERDKKIAEDAVKLARFGRLVGWLAFAAATIAALYAFEMLKPLGGIGKLFAIMPQVQYGAPVVVWLVVFGAVQVYLKYML